MIKFGSIFIANQPILTGAFLFLVITPKNCKKNIPVTLAHRVCTIGVNTEAKRKHLENLKMNFSKYQYPKQSF